MVLPPIVHVAKQNIQKLVQVPKVEWSRLSAQKKLPLMETATVPTLQTNTQHHHHNMKNTSSSSNNRDEDMSMNNMMMMMMTKVPSSVASLEEKKTKKKNNSNNNNNTTPTPQHLLNEHLQIEDFSPKFRSKAKKLLKILKSSDQVASTKCMEFVYKGSVVKNSNIIALIEDALLKVSPPHP